MHRRNISIYFIIYTLIFTFSAPSTLLSQIHKCKTKDGKSIYTTNPSTVEGCTTKVNTPNQDAIYENQKDTNVESKPDGNKSQELIELENRLNEVNSQIYSYQLEKQTIDKKDPFIFYDNEFTEYESKKLYHDCINFIKQYWEYKDSYEYNSSGSVIVGPDVFGNYFTTGQSGYMKPTEISQTIKVCEEYKEEYEIHISKIQRKRNQLTNHINIEMSKLEQEYDEIMKKIQFLENTQN